MTEQLERTARFLLVEDVAGRYGIARRTVHELTRTGRIPHRVLPHTRRVLFEEEWLRAWEDGAELERVDLPGGGRIVRPKAAT
ncbi:MAG: helix-turn-helix transcriptional regulator [Gaiellaceae bacterium]